MEALHGQHRDVLAAERLRRSSSRSRPPAAGPPDDELFALDPSSGIVCVERRSSGWSPRARLDGAGGVADGGKADRVGARRHLEHEKIPVHVGHRAERPCRRAPRWRRSRARRARRRPCRSACPSGRPQRRPARAERERSRGAAARRSGINRRRKPHGRPEHRSLRAPAISRQGVARRPCPPRSTGRVSGRARSGRRLPAARSRRLP